MLTAFLLSVVIVVIGWICILIIAAAMGEKYKPIMDKLLWALVLLIALFYFLNKSNLLPHF